MTNERNKPVHQSPHGTPDTPAGDTADTDDDRVGPAPIPGGCDMTKKTVSLIGAHLSYRLYAPSSLA